MTPDQAYYRASKSGGTDNLRAISCGNPYRAYMYAWNIDKSPREDTRASACKDPQWAYAYADYVDGSLRKDTRLAVCVDSYWALQYALNIEKQLNLLTYGAVFDSEHQEAYEVKLGTPINFVSDKSIVESFRNRDETKKNKGIIC